LNGIRSLKTVVSHWKTIQKKGVPSLPIMTRIWNSYTLHCQIIGNYLLKCCQNNWKLTKGLSAFILQEVFSKKNSILDRLMKKILRVPPNLYHTNDWFPLQWPCAFIDIGNAVFREKVGHCYRPTVALARFDRSADSFLIPKLITTSKGETWRSSNKITKRDEVVEKYSKMPFPPTVRTLKYS